MVAQPKIVTTKAASAKITYSRRTLLTGLILMLLLLTAISASISFILPVYVENKLIPELAHEFGLTPDQFKIRRIGLWGTDLGPVRFSIGGAPAVSIAAVQIDYSPLSLLQGEIKGIALAGLGVVISVSPTKITIAGISLQREPKGPQADTTALDLKTLLPINLNRFSIHQSQLVINIGSQKHTIPFELDLGTHELAEGRLSGQVDLAVAGNPITLNLSADQMANAAKFILDIKNLQLNTLARIGQIPTQIDAVGRVDLGGWAAFELQPFKLAGISMSGLLRDTYIATPNGTLQNATYATANPKPIIFAIEGDGPAKLHWGLAPFDINGPLNIRVDEFKGDMAYTDMKWSLAATLNTRMPKQRLLDSADIAGALAAVWQMTAHGTGAHSAEFELAGQTDGPLVVALADRKLSNHSQAIKINGHYRNSTLYTQGRFTAKDMVVQLPEGDLKAPQLDANATLTIPPADSATPPSLTAHATLSNVHSKFAEMTIHLPKIDIKTSGKKSPHQLWQFNSRFKLAKGRIIDPSKGLELTNLSMALPLRFPHSSGVDRGKINIGAILWNNRQLGGLNGALHQTGNGLTIKARHISKLFPGMRVLINGGIDASGAHFNAEIPQYHLADEIDMGRLAPAAAGIRVSGKIGALGRLAIDGKNVTASGRFKFNHGRLTKEPPGVLLEGIDLEIQMEDLLQMKSAPEQKLRISNLSLGNLRAEHLDIHFQIEDPKTLFVEKAAMNWSQGKMNTSAIRVNAEKEDYAVTLFCDRLNLATMLEQLGAAQADGDGTVSGRIPVRWTKGRLSFEDGFLYSAPGQSGSIQINGTGMLLSSLPPESLQYTQLDIATEALRNYSYKWVKLNVLSEGEILLLKLQFDGKPNRLLPFAYDQALGRFKRVPGEGQADFTGLRIDLNFRNPLNDIIYYKDLLRQQN